MKMGSQGGLESSEAVGLLPGMGQYLKENEGRSVVLDPAKELRQRAKAGDAEAQYVLGSGMVRAGAWSNKADKWLRKAARQGHLEAKRMLVRHLNPGKWGCYDKLVARWTRDLAELGDSQAQYSHAFAQRQQEHCLHWLRKSVDQGFAPAMVEMGYNYANGREGIAADMGRAVELFHRAADQENDEARCLLGMIYAEGRGVEADAAEALRWIEKPLKKGLGQAWLTRGRIYEACGDAEGFRKAMECYRRAAEPHQWDPVLPWLEPLPNCRFYGEAAYHVGRLYNDGIGVDRDDREAAQWYAEAAKDALMNRHPRFHFLHILDAMYATKNELGACRQAARKGDGDAEVELGLGLYNLRRYSRESKEGEKWIERSAHRGNPLGQWAWGILLEHFRENTDAEEVASWYRKSTEQGLPEAQAEMGRYYLGGGYWQERAAAWKHPNGEWDEGATWYFGTFIDRQPDYQQAAEWLRLAADQGMVHAQFELGDLYYRGDGVEQDYSAAAAWRRRACEWMRREWKAGVRARFAGRWIKNTKKD